MLDGSKQIDRYLVMSSPEVSAVDASTIEERLAECELVLIDFWAPWCAPCRALTPQLEEIAKRYTSALRVLKVNVDTAPDLAARYGVRTIPTLILFRDGTPTSQLVGLHSQRELSAWIQAAL